MTAAGARTGFGRYLKSIETVVAMAILASSCLFAGAYFYTILHRERIKAAAHGVRALVLAARMQAVRRERYVVLEVDVDSRELVTWIDQPPENFERDSTEPALGTYLHAGRGRVPIRRGAIGGPDSVAFDKYQWNDPLVDRIVFRETGVSWSTRASTAAHRRDPEGHGVGALIIDRCPPAGCRGIFLADRSGRGTGETSSGSAWTTRAASEDIAAQWLPPDRGECRREGLHSSAVEGVD